MNGYGPNKCKQQLLSFNIYTSVSSSCCLSTFTPFVSFKCDMLVENGYTLWGIFTKAWTYVIVLIKLLNCRFSLSHHHQNHSTNKVKNQRGKRRWIFKQCRKDSGLCNVSCGRYSKKCFTQIYKTMYGDAMFVSLWGAQIWRPEGNKNICHWVFYKEPVVVFWGPINIYMRTYSQARTVQIAKSQRISYFF